MTHKKHLNTHPNQAAAWLGLSLGNTMILATSLFTQHESRDIIAQLIVLLLVILFTTSAIYGIFDKKSKPISLDNKFDLGYIEEPVEYMQEPPQATELDEIETLKRKLEILKLKKQIAEFEKPQVDTNLFQDCLDTVTALGTPTRKAKAEVQNIFDKNPDIKTVQEFITEYGKR